MGKHREPSIRGQKKKAKDKRKALFDQAYRILEAGEVIHATDREYRNGYMHRVSPRNIGLVVTPGWRGRFRRRVRSFISIDEIQ